ncbi:hypothetical protein NCG89_10115 [Spongiibacter taiwanensis]|uniref:hypothetical protein n=1 Tax=Spongiibacter taiwanensis TaxID=1748242 RepID=UPI002035476F|nr:hypothetical protein [Spongiibacter taiwanensis]USA41873.1 hypothetical protein NCG89_10115 [Spongiibacter taiwanensis]
MTFAILTLLNALNCYIFWLMWGGFYGNVKHEGVFSQALIFQILVTLVSIGFFVIREKPLAQKPAPSLNKPIGGMAGHKFAALVGAFTLAITNVLVAGVFLLVSGGIDILGAGNAI